MTVFLMKTLDLLIQLFYLKFIKKEVLSVTSTLALLKFNLHDSSSKLSVSLVDAGFELMQQLNSSNPLAS